MIDYLAWRGDITFSEREPNDVDNLIFSTLAYLNMDTLVSSDAAPQYSLEELLALYEASDNDQRAIFIDPAPLLRAAVRCPRFGGVKVGAYVNEIDRSRDLQFSATTFFLEDGSVFVAYRGTDLTIVGWREDFELSYLPETAGQGLARDYLDEIGAATCGAITVGGHSKGGNFAVYASAFCDRAVQDRIRKVYSNDGPGFNDSVSESERYSAITDRIVKFIPESSIVGTLLLGREKPVYIRSSVRGPIQHDPYSWKVARTSFVRVGTRSSGGALYDNAFTAWISGLDNDERRRFVCSLFELLEASGATTLADLREKKWIPYNALARAIRNSSATDHREVMSGLRKLASASRDAVWNEAKLTFERHEPRRAKKRLNAPGK